MRRLITLIGVAATTLAASAPTAAAKSLKVSGRLDQAGYQVVALGYNGKAVVSKSRSFTIKLPDSRATLQLRNSRGKYAGPVIVAGSGSKVYEGLKAGAHLGTIKVLNGYARTSKPLSSKYVDRGRWVQARRGVPIGNGRNFGLVRSRIHNGPSGPGGDTSRTGVPNAFSIDRDGDGVIDALKRGARLAADAAADPTPPPPAPAPPGPPTGFSFFSQIFLDLGATLNADATGVTQAQIDAMLPQYLNIVGVNVPQGDQVALDCGGLSYCSAGGTGALATDMAPNPTLQPFPSCCDPSGDGFGNLRGPDAIGLGAHAQSNDWGFFYPRATSTQIGSGDAFVLRVTSGGTLTQVPATLSFVFNTVPALSAYTDGAGDSGTISYPVAPGAPGTQGNPIPVAASSSGDVVFSMSFWRPQRRGIPGAGEPAMIDIGQLDYTVDAVSLAQAAYTTTTGTAPTPGSGPNAAVCSAESLITSDPHLSLSGSGANMGQLLDSSSDQPANPVNLLGFSVDLTKCLADAGVSSFPVGTQGAVGLKADAPNSSDHAVQNIWVKRVS